MKEKFTIVRLDAMVTAFLSIIMGVVLFLYPEQTIIMSSQIIGVVMLLVGGILIVLFLVHISTSPVTIITGVVFAAVGLWIFISPHQIASLIPVLLGLIMVYHGIRNISFAWTSRGRGYRGWGTMLFFALLGLGVGIFCIVKAFMLAALAAKIMGIMLIYDGLSHMIIILMAFMAYIKGENDGSRDIKTGKAHGKSGKIKEEGVEDRNFIEGDFREID